MQHCLACLQLAHDYALIRNNAPLRTALGVDQMQVDTHAHANTPPPTVPSTLPHSPPPSHSPTRARTHMHLHTRAQTHAHNAPNTRCLRAKHVGYVVPPGGAWAIARLRVSLYIARACLVPQVHQLHKHRGARGPPLQQPTPKPLVAASERRDAMQCTLCRTLAARPVFMLRSRTSRRSLRGTCSRSTPPRYP